MFFQTDLKYKYLVKICEGSLLYSPEGVSEKNILGHLCRKILKNGPFFDIFGLFFKNQPIPKTRGVIIKF